MYVDRTFLVLTGCGLSMVLLPYIYVALYYDIADKNGRSDIDVALYYDIADKNELYDLLFLISGSFLDKFDILVEQSNQVYTSQLETPPVTLQEEDDHFLIIHRDRFESDGITSDKPVCNVFAGNLQYAVEWITRHPHKVEGIECRAMGHPVDVFRIEKAATEE